jgi:general secretion pathway protein I
MKTNLRPKLLRLAAGEAGFTLLEVMIASAIMLIAFSAILMIESSSIDASLKSKRLNTVTMLAKTKMIETEMEIEGKSFSEIPKEKSETFKEPYQDYRWKRVIKEITIPNFAASVTSGAASSGGSEGGNASGGGEAQDRLGKLVTNYLSKAVREVTLTVTWKSGKGEQSYQIATYWVNLNHEFQLSE